MTTTDDRPAWRRAASVAKRRVMAGRSFVRWARQDLVANPRLALYARRMNRHNMRFVTDLRARGAEATRDYLAAADVPEMPRIVWIYWHDGEAEAPFLVRRCIRTWRDRNPGWDVRVLCARTVAPHADLSDLPSGLPLRYHANMLRVRLMRDHGGVWTDATTWCHRPLDEWLWLHMTGGFYVFRDGGPDRVVENWFIASTPGHRLARHWADDFAAHLARVPRVSDSYFIHFYVLQHRIMTDPLARAAFRRVAGLPAPPTFVMIEALRGVLPIEQIRRLVAAGLPLSKLSWHGAVDEAAFDAFCAAVEAPPAPPAPSGAA